MADIENTNSIAVISVDEQMINKDAEPQHIFPVPSYTDGWWAWGAVFRMFARYAISLL